MKMAAAERTVDDYGNQACDVCRRFVGVDGVFGRGLVFNNWIIRILNSCS